MLHLCLNLAAKLKMPVGSGVGQAVRKLVFEIRCSFPGVWSAFARGP